MSAEAEFERLFATWNRGLGDAVAAVGRPEFFALLGAALAVLAPHDVCMVFGYHGRGTPSRLHHGLDPERRRLIIDNYADGPYVLDPFFHATTERGLTGLHRLADLAPDLFFDSEYYRRHYRSTGIRDEIGFFVQRGNGRSAVLSLTRPMTEPAFDDTEVARLAAAEPVVGPLVAAHCTVAGLGLDDEDRPDPAAAALAALGDGELTPREIEIMRMILQGHSNPSIAAVLGIALGTVKVHRKNLYAKLRLSSQGDLFNRFIAALTRVLAEARA